MTFFAPIRRLFAKPPVGKDPQLAPDQERETSIDLNDLSFGDGYRAVLEADRGLSFPKAEQLLKKIHEELRPILSEGGPLYDLIVGIGISLPDDPVQFELDHRPLPTIVIDPAKAQEIGDDWPLSIGGIPIQYRFETFELLAAESQDGS